LHPPLQTRIIKDGLLKHHKRATSAKLVDHKGQDLPPGKNVGDGSHCQPEKNQSTKNALGTTLHGRRIAEPEGLFNRIVWIKKLLLKSQSLSAEMMHVLGRKLHEDHP